MLILYNLLIFIVGLILLVKGADKFIDKLKLIALSLNMSEFIIGVLLASIATTLPEISVSVMASFQGRSSLALGNALGSVLVNISLILGIPACFSSIKVDERGWKNSLLLLFLSILVGLMILDKKLGRIEGLSLIGLYIFYVRFNIKSTISSREEYKENYKKVKIKDFIEVFLMAGVIILGSKLLIDSAVFFARLLRISEMIIGLTIVAFGTSLPEFANTVLSLIKKTPNIGFGNIVGANFLNLLVVVGLSSIINPINVEEEFIYLTIPLMMIVISVLTISLKRDNIIGRKTGIALVFLYLLFIYFNLKF